MQQNQIYTVLGLGALGTIISTATFVTIAYYNLLPQWMILPLIILFVGGTVRGMISLHLYFTKEERKERVNEIINRSNGKERD